MFCPSCGGLAYPRKGVLNNSYARLYAVKKDKAVWEEEKLNHYDQEPSQQDFQDQNEFYHANAEWANKIPGEFEQQPLGDDVEKKGKDYIECKNGNCGFHGPADGVDKDLLNVKSSTKAKGRVYDVVKDSDKRHGVLTTESYMCPKCDLMEVFAYLEQTRSSDEPETRMLTCKNCGHGWREY